MRTLMVYVIYCWATLVEEKELNWKDIVEGKDDRSICNETFFTENFLKKGTYLPINYLSDRCQQYFSETCHELAGEVHYTTGNDGLLVVINKRDVYKTENRGCWGLVIQYENATTQITNYDYFSEDGDVFDVVKAGEFTSYHVAVAMFPTGPIARFTWTSPGRCEKAVLNAIETKIQEKQLNCELELGYNDRLKFATKFCKTFDDPQERKSILELKLTITDCNLPETQQLVNVPSQSKNHDYIIVTATVVLVLILAGCLLCIMKTLRKTKNKKAAEICEEGKNILKQRDHGPRKISVMILNRPGCELLENFLRDFACVLQSYGIHVKMALLERNAIDAEGGIASYMQRYISECDYILIMFTEAATKDKEIAIHRPYEFSLKLIGGLAFHQNDGSHYIPMYLTPYETAVNMLPSFFNASTTFGYRLPKDLGQILKKILGKSPLRATKAREIKDNFFIQSMYDQCKLILARRHPHCIVENCIKGVLNGSVNNLSSIWPSTMNSKWESVQSIISVNEPIKNINIASYQANLLSKYNTMISGQAMGSSESNDEFIEADETSNKHSTNNLNTLTS